MWIGPLPHIGIIAQLRQDIVGSIEQCCAARKVWNKHPLTALAELAWQPQLSRAILILLGRGIGYQVIQFSVKRKVLQPMMSAICYNQHGLTRGALAGSTLSGPHLYA